MIKPPVKFFSPALKSKTIKLSLFVFLACFLPSCGGDSTAVKVKNWQILYEQDDSPAAALQKDGWQDVQIPLRFRLPYAAKNDFQFVWLRGEFDVSGDPAVYSGLSTGRIRYSDRIYLNGKLAGETRPEKVNWSPAPRNYVIPPGCITGGKNIIMIRLGVYSRYEGGILNDVYIQGEYEFETARFFNDLIYRHLPFMMLVIFVGFSISLFIVYLLNRKEKLPLYTMSGLLIYIIYMLTLLPVNRLVGYEVYLLILMSIIPLFSISIIMFIQSLYRIYLNSQNRIIISLLVVFAAVMILFRNSEGNIRIGFWITNISLCLSISYMTFLIFRLNSINPDRFLRNTMIMMSISAAFIILFEYYAFYTGRYYSDLAAKSSPLIFLILFAVIFHREILRRQIEIDFVYKKLSRFEGRDRDVSITDSSEEKLKRVIDFINENYTEDISREGLAAAIGMNPNYMGSQFKTYAGRTINEYINMLRINEAMRQLDESRSKVIDIAFNVGFENVVTFNRVFKKVTGKTPSEYKNK